jgi:hypothetical protein
VGQNNGPNLFPVLGEVADIGYDNINAQKLFFGKHQAGIDDDDVILPPEGRAVHTELAQATKGDYA